MMPLSNVASVAVGLGVLLLVVHLTTIYLHRGVAHGGVRYRPWLEQGMHAVHLVLTGIKVKQWTAVHTYHHVFPDKAGDPGDPHSPYLEGVWHIVFFNVYYYAKAAKDLRVWAHPFVQERIAGIPTRRIDAIGLWGPLLAWAAAIVFFGWRSGLIMGLVYVVPYLLLLGAVNGMAHYWGRKNFASASAFNLKWLAVLTAGEGLHNNHHARFTSPFLAYRPAEWLCDSGGVTIRVLRALRLAEIVSPGPSN
jgi:stearoyl-CoA desaturase (delta-9 desaturase)